MIKHYSKERKREEGGDRKRVGKMKKREKRWMEGDKVC